MENEKFPFSPSPLLPFSPSPLLPFYPSPLLLLFSASPLLFSSPPPLLFPVSYQAPSHKLSLPFRDTWKICRPLNSLEQILTHTEGY